MGPKDTPFEGGVFAAKLTFVSAARSFPHATNEHNAMQCTALHRGTAQPPDYPLSPFKMKFEPPLFHPNSKPQRARRAPLPRHRLHVSPCAPRMPS